MYNYKIENIIFKNGFNLNPKNLVVFIGPNNCGKSQILKDILKSITDENPDNIIIDDINFNWPSDFDEIKKSYNIRTSHDGKGNYFLKTFNSVLNGSKNIHIHNNWETDIEKWIGGKQKGLFAKFFGNFLVNFLGTENRLRNILQSQSGDINSEITNLLQAVYKEGKGIEDKLRLLVKECFKLDILLDFTNLINLCFRVDKEFCDIPTDPREARGILEKYRKLDDQGDGIKSFISSFLALHVGKKPILLIDEPEAFLHPPQAMKLGEIIAEQADDSKSQIFIATHSSDLLRGILNKRQNIDLIRITRQDDKNYISQLNPTEVNKIAHDPLLSSTRILEGLFYSGAVVTEADSDSIFYQRISRQLFGNDDIHYTHSHNKQTVAKVAVPYSKLSVSHAIIVDFDILRVWDEFKNLLKQKYVKPEIIEEIKEFRSTIVKEIEAKSPNKILDNLKNGPVKYFV